jgi:hypothetical protein
MEFHILRNPSLWIALHPLELQQLTKYYFQLLVFITMIVLEMFTNGFYILGFDLTPDRETDEHISLLRRGNVRIDAL